MSLESRITTLESLFPKPEGTEIKRALASEAGTLWSIGFGQMGKPLAFFVGNTLEEALTRAETSLLQISVNGRTLTPEENRVFVACLKDFQPLCTRDSGTHRLYSTRLTEIFQILQRTPAKLQSSNLPLPAPGQEPNIAINGHKLDIGQSLTARVAISSCVPTENTPAHQTLLKTLLLE
jgi:hypothetical protein